MMKILSAEEETVEIIKSLTKKEARMKLIKGILFSIVAFVVVAIVLPAVQQHFKLEGLYNEVVKAVAGLISIYFGYLAVSCFADYIYLAIVDITGKASASLIRTTCKIIGIIILFSITIASLNISTTTAVTLGSFLGMLFGFAMQKSLGNFLAGFFIIITRPFKPGDVISAQGATGVVEEISPLYTIIRTEDGTKILLPNSKLVDAVIKVKEATQTSQQGQR